MAQLYLHGLALGDCDLALRGRLGEGAPLAASSVERLKAKWQVDYASWSKRRLDDVELVYVWADGVDVQAGLEKDKAALLVGVGALKDGRTVVLAVKAGHRESKESWREVWRDLKARGLKGPKRLVADGHLGIWAGGGEVWPEVQEQRCWTHKIVNVLDKRPKRLQAEAREMLPAMPYAPPAQRPRRSAMSSPGSTARRSRRRLRRGSGTGTGW